MSIKSLEVGRKCTGYHQLVSFATAQRCPGTGVVVALQAEAGDVRYRLDGTAPTTTIGFLLSDGETHIINVGENGNVSDIQVIEVDSSAILNVHCFR